MLIKSFVVTKDDLDRKGHTAQSDVLEQIRQWADSIIEQHTEEWRLAHDIRVSSKEQLDGSFILTAEIYEREI